MCGLEWNTTLLTTTLSTMLLTSDAGVSTTAFEPQDDILNIHYDISQNVVNCNKIKLKFIVKLDIYFRLSIVSTSFATSTFHKVV